MAHDVVSLRGMGRKLRGRMGVHLHIVASCADRKRGDRDGAVRLRDFRTPDARDRADRWWAALRSADGLRTPARDLYLGPYWSVVRDLPSAAAARHLDLRLWIASAGYGLVPLDAPLKNYSATFSSGMPDSVLRPNDVARGFARCDWWTALAQKPGPVGGPRTLASLASEPGARMLVLGSPSYLTALEHDLVDAVSALGSAEKLIIISGEPGPRSDRLRPSWIASTANLLSELGGALPSLHARLARRLLDEAPEHGIDATELSARWQQIAARAPHPPKIDRAPSSDPQVKSFIRESLRGRPSLTHTRALRNFRAAGRACEQARFRDLFKSVQQARGR